MRLTFDVLQFHLLFGYNCALVTGYLDNSNNKITSCRNVRYGLSCDENTILKQKAVETRTLRQLIRTKITQTCIQFDIPYTGCSMGDLF